MKRQRSLIILSLYLKVSVSSETKQGENVSVRVKLDSKFQREILQQVEKKLTEISGVHSVNLSSLKSHALIEVNSGEITPHALIAAIESIKGDSWQCTADFYRETVHPEWAEDHRIKGKTNWLRHPQLNAAQFLRPVYDLKKRKPRTEYKPNIME